jgi:hypothetical protein
MINQLFGYPVYRSSIDPKKYDKKNIISSIEKNYKKNPKRNEWEKNDLLKSNIHHLSMDEKNQEYAFVDFSSLIPLYTKEIEKFVSNLELKNEISFYYEIVNYTASSSDQFMNSHVHTCDFSGVHYIQFHKNHFSTFFRNPASYANYLPQISHDLVNSLDHKYLKNSWANKLWNFETKEDDIVIFPGAAEHFVPPSEESEIIRMTVVFNIIIKK